MTATETKFTVTASAREVAEQVTRLARCKVVFTESIGDAASRVFLLAGSHEKQIGQVADYRHEVAKFAAKGGYASVIGYYHNESQSWKATVTLLEGAPVGESEITSAVKAEIASKLRKQRAAEEAKRKAENDARRVREETGREIMSIMRHAGIDCSNGIRWSDVLSTNLDAASLERIKQLPMSGTCYDAAVYGGKVYRVSVCYTDTYATRVVEIAAA